MKQKSFFMKDFSGLLVLVLGLMAFSFGSFAEASSFGNESFPRRLKDTGRGGSSKEYDNPVYFEFGDGT